MRARKSIHRAIEVCFDDARIGAELAQDARHDAAFWVEQRD